MEYKIMEYIMRNVIFENKSLRESFMQEVLISSSVSNYRTNLEKYLNANHITVNNYRPSVTGELCRKNIRIIEISKSEINIKVVEILGVNDQKKE